MLELFKEGMVRLGGYEVIDHVHGRSEEDPDVRIACSSCDAIGEKGLSRAWIADQNHVPSLFNKLQVQEMKDLGLVIFP